MAPELSIEESVRLLERRAQQEFQVHPARYLDQAIIGLQSVRAVLRIHRENLTTLDAEGIDRGEKGFPEIIPEERNYCIRCDPDPDLDIWNGSSHRYGVSLGHHGVRADGNWLIPWFNGERQLQVTECLAGAHGWILRFNPMLVCLHCGYMDRMLELRSGQVEIRLVPCDAQGYPERAIVGPALD